MDADPAHVTSLHYRGEGWPGTFRAGLDDGSATPPLSYAESWGRLTGYRSLRCNLCPDGLGRIADISCGDAWHALPGSDGKGRSLVLVRTERGRQILRRAMAAKYVQLTPVSADAVLSAQKNLLRRRRELFGRLVALRLLLIPIPKFSNFSLRRSWLRLPLWRKTQTIAGTLRRAILRRWWQRRRVIA